MFDGDAFVFALILDDLERDFCLFNQKIAVPCSVRRRADIRRIDIRRVLIAGHYGQKFAVERNADIRLHLLGLEAWLRRQLMVDRVLIQFM